MIRYFKEGLRPSIRAEIEQRSRELDIFKGLVEKTVDAEAKAAFRPRFYARETDQHCPQGSRLANSSITKAQDQSSFRKDLRTEEPRSKPQKPKSSSPQQKAETPKKARKKKKKKGQQYD